MVGIVRPGRICQSVLKTVYGVVSVHALDCLCRPSWLFPTLDWNECAAVEKAEDRVSGAWVFKGTRVPVTALFANLEDGRRIDNFLDWFPGVSREEIEAPLKHVEASLGVA